MARDGRDSGWTNTWVLIPCGFGFWWLAAGLSALEPLSGRMWAALVAGAAVVAASGLIRRRRARIIDRRTFRLGILAESVGLAAVLLGCGLARRPELIMPMIGAVVGLHFLPLAKAFDDRRFGLAGFLMTGLCLMSLLWQPPLRVAIAGVGTGAVLWAFALWASLQPADRTVRPRGFPSLEGDRVRSPGR